MVFKIIGSTSVIVLFSLQPPPAPSHDPDDDEDHGGLVKKILETKKELEGGSQTSNAKIPRKTEIVSSLIFTNLHKSYQVPRDTYLNQFENS